MSKELSLNKEKLKEKELTYKEKMTEKDLRYQEYEAIQADEEIPVGERVHREKEAAVVSIIEPGSHTIPTNTTVSKKVADQKKPKNKHSAHQQHTRSKCASSVDRSEHLTNQREAVEASSSKPGDKVRVSWGENSAAAVKANSRTVDVEPSSHEVVQLESTSAKDLRSLRRENERARQVLKEKEQATKVSAIPVPVIEISDEEDEAEVFERHWSSKICNKCGSSVRLHWFTSAPARPQTIPF